MAETGRSLTIENSIRKNIEAKIGQVLTDEECEQLNEWFVPVQLEKKEQFVVEGKVCRSLFFVDTGATHTYLV